MVDDLGGMQELTRLMYADQPDHLRHAGGPWVGVAKAVEQALAVLEDGQRKLAEVWRSPAGATYLAEMDRVIQAMRATSEAARHNDQVMRTAAETLDAKQKDFAVLAGAPIPEDARQRYARAIVKSLDESYEQAIADFYPVPVLTETPIEEDRPLVPHGFENPTTPHGAGAGGSSGTTGSVGKGGAPRTMPSWVPTQPAGQDTNESRSTVDSGLTVGTAPSGGPQLQGAAGSGTYPAGAHPGTGAHPGVGPSVTPDVPVPSGSVRPPSSLGGGEGPDAYPPQAPPHTPNSRDPARSRAPGTPTFDAGPTSRRPNTAHAGGGGQPGAMVGGVPPGLPANGGRHPWQGYRRPLERFPMAKRPVVPPIIGPGSGGGSQPDFVATDYEDEYGNRITIRRPND